MSWDIEYGKNTAECVYIDIERYKHLTEFEVAKSKLKRLKSYLEQKAFDADWLADKCKNEAVHYEALRQQYSENPQEITPLIEKEISKKSPEKLYKYADNLREAANVMRNMISMVDKILSRLKRAKDEAKNNSKNILDKISKAIYLMDIYLKVEF